MASKTLRVLTSLAVVVIAYLAYSLLVVPKIGPAQASSAPRPPRQQADTTRLPYQFERLRPFFQSSDWELQQPIIIENPQFTLLLGDYESLPGGQVRLSPCTLIFFPDGRPPEPSPESRVLIMRAPEGAVLDFDEEIDLSRAETGRLKGGRLVGQVTIEGNLGPLEAGSPDRNDEKYDLWVATRDVELRSDRIWTPHTVQFRLGPNRGRGRDMRMLLAGGGLGTPGGLSDKQSPLRSFQLLHDVQLHGDFNWDGLLPGSEQNKQKTPPARRDGQAGNELVDKSINQSVDVRCRGRFRFDVEKLAANFEDQVDVVRQQPDGATDELHCDLLTIYFDTPGKTPATVEPHNQPSDKLTSELATRRRRSLEVTRIEARGQPAVASSATAKGFVQGEYLELDIRSRRVFLSDRREVTVKYNTTQLQASQVRYLAGPSGELGKLWASGPGSLRSQLPGRQGETLQAAWRGQLQIRPHEGRQLLSLVEKVEVSSNQTGNLQSDEIWIWLRPTQVAAGEQPSASPSQARFEPERIMATGNVAINSTPLSGAVNRLEAWFQPVAAAADSSSGNQQSVTGGLAGSKDFGDIKNHYHVRGETVQLQFGMVQRKPVLQNASIDGNVYLVERTAGGDGEEPLSVRGQQIEIRQADTPQAALSVSGTPAQVTARGLAIFGPSVHVSKAANKIWVDGAGKMTLPVDRDLQGKRLDKRQSLDVNWQDRMVFDGQTARFENNIVASSQYQQLQTGQLDVILNQKILFGQSTQQQIDVQRVTCRGGVLLDSASFTGQQRSSWEKLHVADMSINQSTGEIHASGPGWIKSVRTGSTVKLGGGKPEGKAAGPPANGPGDTGLVFLKVDFQRAITGNLHRRELFFGDQTRCIYGPVGDWSQELDLDRTSGPQGQEVILTCDQLALRQMAAASKDRRPIEIEATGNATVEGASFTATGQRLTYTTAKELLVLEGAGQTPAQLVQQKRPGAAPARFAADKILYWRAQNRVEVQGVRFGTGSWQGDR